VGAGGGGGRRVLKGRGGAFTDKRNDRGEDTLYTTIAQTGLA
jgi:hypothetical protein